jgi:hypothetical protein
MMAANFKVRPAVPPAGGMFGSIDGGMFGSNPNSEMLWIQGQTRNVPKSVGFRNMIAAKTS